MRACVGPAVAVDASSIPRTEPVVLSESAMKLLYMNGVYPPATSIPVTSAVPFEVTLMILFWPAAFAEELLSVERRIPRTVELPTDWIVAPPPEPRAAEADPAPLAVVM